MRQAIFSLTGQLFAVLVAATALVIESVKLYNSSRLSVHFLLFWFLPLILLNVDDSSI